MDVIFPQTAEQLERWKADPDVVGVVLVGSKSRGNNDALSDDDLEILLAEEAHAGLAPAECQALFIEGEGAARRMIYDAELTTLEDLRRKVNSPHDLDHWPYEKAPVLFDRNGDVAEAVKAAGRMDPDFRQKRLVHATVDADTAAYRAAKTLQRGFEAAGHLIVARGALALSRVAFALEWRWVPLDHWLEPELKSLQDPDKAGPDIVEALRTGRPEPLRAALERLEDRLFEEGIPRPRQRRALFMEIIHPTRAEERSIHGLH